MPSQLQPACAAGSLYPFPNMPNGWCFRQATFLLAYSLSPLFTACCREGQCAHTALKKGERARKRSSHLFKEGLFQLPTAIAFASLAT